MKLGEVQFQTGQLDTCLLGACTGVFVSGLEVSKNCCVFLIDTHLGSEHVDEALRGALEGDPSEEEDGEDEVGEHRREVDDLAGAGDPWGHHQLISAYYSFET